MKIWLSIYHWVRRSLRRGNTYEDGVRDGRIIESQAQRTRANDNVPIAGWWH